MTQTLTRSRIAMLAATALLLANVVVPVICGDVYPFTSAPMFRDRPREFCNYHVFDAAGSELPEADWLVQRVYDGNPVGYGVGVRPPNVLEQQFGVVHDEATVRQHFRQQLTKPEHRHHRFVDVVQEVVGPADAHDVGVVRSQRWRVAR